MLALDQAAIDEVRQAEEGGPLLDLPHQLLRKGIQIVIGKAPESPGRLGIVSLPVQPLALRRIEKAREGNRIGTSILGVGGGGQDGLPGLLVDGMDVEAAIQHELRGRPVEVLDILVHVVTAPVEGHPAVRKRVLHGIVDEVVFLTG